MGPNKLTKKQREGALRALDIRCKKCHKSPDVVFKYVHNKPKLQHELIYILFFDIRCEFCNTSCNNIEQLKFFKDKSLKYNIYYQLMHSSINSFRDRFYSKYYAESKEEKVVKPKPRKKAKLSRPHAPWA